jgi:hypothetical protein
VQSEDGSFASLLCASHASATASSSPYWSEKRAAEEVLHARRTHHQPITLLQEGVNEGRKQSQKIPEDEAETFRLYFHLLYANRLAVIADSSDEDVTAIYETTLLAKLYVLAEELQDPNAKNKALAAMLAGSHQARTNGTSYVPGVVTIRIISEGTSVGYKLHQPILDLWTASAMDK